MCEIPKKIIHTWETKELSEEFQTIVNTWKIPGFEYQLFDKEDRVAFIKQHFHFVVLEAYHSIIPGANKADFFRYAYLYIHGGIYTDIDTMYIGNIDTILLPGVEFIAAVDLNVNPAEGSHNIMNGTILAAKPGHPIFLMCLNFIIKNIRNNILYNSPLDFTGPGVLGRCVNVFLGNPEEASFIGKEGIQKGCLLMHFERGSEYFGHTCTIGQNKNGNPEIQRIYYAECSRTPNFISWLGPYKFNPRKKIALYFYGEYRTYKQNLRHNITMLAPILKNHHVHVFILSDKRSYCEESERDIRNILEEYFFTVSYFDYTEETPEENEMVKTFLSKIHNKNGIQNDFAPRIIYRRYVLHNKINIDADLYVYCRLFDMIIQQNKSYKEIEKAVEQNTGVLGSNGDTFLIGKKEPMQYLFQLYLLYTKGVVYHNMWLDPDCSAFIKSMDLCLHQTRATYSPEIQYITHMYYSPFTYKNIRVDYNNPNSLQTELYHVRHDPSRK